MRCPNCGVENRPGAQFCRQCAAPLTGAAAPGRAAPRQASPTVSLVIQRGPQAGQMFTLRDGVNTVGRDPGNDVLLYEDSVSRSHARVVVQPEGVWIEDLGSTSGTLVNGQRVTGSTWLRSGDVVQLGGAVVLGVQVGPAMAPAFPAAPPSVAAPTAAVPLAAAGQVCPRCGAQNRPGVRFCARCAAPLVMPAPAPSPVVAAPPVSLPKARRRWIWAVGGVAALLVVVVVVGVIGMKMLSGGAVAKETPVGEGPVTEAEARQIAQDVIEDAFPQFVDSEPTFYHAEFEGRPFYRATYDASYTVTDAEGNPVDLVEIVSISVDEETGKVSVAASN